MKRLSNLLSPNEIYGPVFQRIGYDASNVKTKVKLLPGLPNSIGILYNSLVVQWMRARLSESLDAGSIPAEATKWNTNILVIGAENADQQNTLSFYRILLLEFVVIVT